MYLHPSQLSGAMVQRLESTSLRECLGWEQLFASLSLSPLFRSLPLAFSAAVSYKSPVSSKHISCLCILSHDNSDATIAVTGAPNSNTRPTSHHSTRECQTAKHTPTSRGLNCYDRKQWFLFLASILGDNRSQSDRQNSSGGLKNWSLPSECRSTLLPRDHWSQELLIFDLFVHRQGLSPVSIII